MTKIDKIADSEVYHVEIDDGTYEVEVRTDKEGKKSIVGELQDKIDPYIWESIEGSVKQGSSIEDALKILK